MSTSCFIILLLDTNHHGSHRRIGAYHGRPASVSRSEIDVDMPMSAEPCGDDSSLMLFDSSHLIRSIELTGQIEAFLQEM
jgi:hypothetical protein